MKAQAQGPQIPAADFTATGSIDREQLVLGRFDGTTLRGRLSGSGRVSWVGDEPWRAAVERANARPRGAAARPAGRVDVVGDIDGRGFRADAPWTARLDVAVRHDARQAADRARRGVARAGTYDLSGVRIANGGSHVDIDGRWGPSVDLRWSADVRSLSAAAPVLRGELVSPGIARGSRGTAAGPGRGSRAQLRYGGIAVEVDARPTSTWISPTSASRASTCGPRPWMASGTAIRDRARCRRKARPPSTTSRITATSRGNPEHRLAGFKAALAASGAADVDKRAWQGQLLEASFDFPDGGARLAQPGALEVGPTLVTTAPLCLATGDARLCAEGEWHSSPDSWRVLYSAQDWPLRRLLTTLLGWREFDGKLQASGWAEQQPGREWVGGTTLLLDDPTFDIPRNQFRTERRQDRSAARAGPVRGAEDELRATAEMHDGGQHRAARRGPGRRGPGVARSATAR